eukprot:7382714-Prymnesium_polylepis.1
MPKVCHVRKAEVDAQPRRKQPARASSSARSASVQDLAGALALLRTASCASATPRASHTRVRGRVRAMIRTHAWCAEPTAALSILL